MQIKTLPVYSKIADNVPSEIKLPNNWQLSQHQVETYIALISGEYDVIFNTAMTGDGKSLAGQLPTLLDFENNPLFAMFPTNELIRDQEKKLEQTKKLWDNNLFPAPLDKAEFYQAVKRAGLPQRRFEQANGPQKGPYSSQITYLKARYNYGKRTNS